MDLLCQQTILNYITTCQGFQSYPKLAAGPRMNAESSSGSGVTMPGNR